MLTDANISMSVSGKAIDNFHRLKGKLMVFEGLDRVSVLVKDLDKAVAFFADLFGIRFDGVVEHSSIQIRVAFAGGFGLELASPMSDRTEMSAASLDHLNTKGEGISYVVVKVRDLDAAVARFAERGIRPIAKVGVGDAREAFFDPDDLYGIPLVLNEFSTPHGMTAHALQAANGSGVTIVSG